MALINQGAALEGFGRQADAAAVYQRVIDRFDTDPDPALRRHVERATGRLGIHCRQRICRAGL
jgi:hypothetical protein